ncbi:MAG: GntR family transcriptional regulator [Parvibaculaceae bacterium]
MSDNSSLRGHIASGLQRPDTLTETVVIHVRDMILDGRYAPGSALPEMTLAAELQTSRGTVREALRKLSELGLVEIITHKGAFVPKLSAGRAREIVDLRALLESHALAIAVREQRVTAQVREQVGLAFERLKRADETGSAFETVEADLALHAVMAAASGRTMLSELLANIQIRSRQFILQSRIYNAGVGKQAATHESLIEAFYSGDPDLAAAAVDEHIRGSGARLLARMAKLGVTE